MLYIKYDQKHIQVSQGYLSKHVIVENWTICSIVYIISAGQQYTFDTRF